MEEMEIKIRIKIKIRRIPLKIESAHPPATFILRWCLSL